MDAGERIRWGPVCRTLGRSLLVAQPSSVVPICTLAEYSLLFHRRSEGERRRSVSAQGLCKAEFASGPWGPSCCHRKGEETLGKQWASVSSSLQWG